MTEVLINDKLAAWIEGAELKFKKSRYNKNLLLGSMVALGGVAVSSGDKNVRSAGLAGAAVGIGGLAGAGISRDYKAVNSGKKGINQTVYVPESHILTPFKIAPESYVRRWIVISNELVKISAEEKKQKDKPRPEISILTVAVVKPEKGEEVESVFSTRVRMARPAGY